MTQPQTTHRILYVGGSFGGMASLVEFLRLYTTAPTPRPSVEITLIEPRAGFINLLGIPRAIIDVDFARETYMNIDKFRRVKFSSVETTFESVRLALETSELEELPEGVTVKFIQGKCTAFTDAHHAEYVLEGGEEKGVVEFDYCQIATGRRRRWPFDPHALTEEEYAEEMEKSKAEVVKAQNITVIGGGALGIEIAGEIKETYPEKKVVLVHPHPYVPPEIFSSKNFRKKLASEIEEAGVEMMFSTRIKEELENGDLVTTDGRVLQSDLNMWCNYHKNNIEFLLPTFKDSIEEDREEVIVDERMLMKGHENIFVVGDITNFRIIKTCGGAWHQGMYVAESMFNILILGKEEYHTVNMKTWPHGMTIVVGCHRVVCQWNDIGDGKVVYNPKFSVNYYKDYGCTDIRDKLFIEH